MKISFDIDCTPEEARTFFGLPDLQPLHDVYLDRMKTAMTEGISAAPSSVRIPSGVMTGVSMRPTARVAF